MSIPALQVTDLTKTWPAFCLDQVSFTVPQGTCTALIGENGSGKSTILRCLLGMDVFSGGSVSVFGENPLDNPEVHVLMGYCADRLLFPEIFTPAQVSQLFSRLYPVWHQDKFEDILRTQGISMHQKLKKMSRGMKAKVSLASALCHEAPLLLLDEATGGLDPVVREEMLDLLQAYMEEEEGRSILITSHISSDLERIADEIVLIQNGRIVLQGNKEALLSQMVLARVRKDQLELLDPALIVTMRPQALHTEVLIRDKEDFLARYPDYAWDPLRLDDLVLLFSAHTDKDRREESDSRKGAEGSLKTDRRKAQ